MQFVWLPQSFLQGLQPQSNRTLGAKVHLGHTGTTEMKKLKKIELQIDKIHCNPM